jgi:hypothetical protein
MKRTGADHEVKLPFDDVLLPWTLKHDREAARIIQAVQAKALPDHGCGLNFNDQEVERIRVSTENVTKFKPSQNQQVMKKGRGRRRKYENDAKRQKAYRERKEALPLSAL